MNSKIFWIFFVVLGVYSHLDLIVSTPHPAQQVRVKVIYKGQESPGRTRGDVKFYVDYQELGDSKRTGRTALSYDEWEKIGKGHECVVTKHPYKWSEAPKRDVVMATTFWCLVFYILFIRKEDYEDYEDGWDDSWRVF